MNSSWAFSTLAGFFSPANSRWNASSTSEGKFSGVMHSNSIASAMRSWTKTSFYSFSMRNNWLKVFKLKKRTQKFAQQKVCLRNRVPYYFRTTIAQPSPRTKQLRSGFSRLNNKFKNYNFFKNNITSFSILLCCLM